MGSPVDIKNEILRCIIKLYQEEDASLDSTLNHAARSYMDSSVDSRNPDYYDRTKAKKDAYKVLSDKIIKEVRSLKL